MSDTRTPDTGRPDRDVLTEELERRLLQHDDEAATLFPNHRLLAALKDTITDLQAQLAALPLDDH